MASNPRIILVGVDGSKFSEEAFNWFKDHYAYPQTDKVLLYHCVYPSASVSAPILRGMVTNPEKDYGIQLARLKEEAALLEAKFMNKCRKHGLQCSWRTVVGDPNRNIVSAAEQEKADLIVVGTRGLNLIQRTLIGSVSTYITQHVNIPVLIVPSLSE